MSIRVTIDESNWIALPASFPTGDDATADDWLNRVVDGIRASWTGDFDAAVEREVRDELRSGLASVRPEDSVALQYWRWSRPVAAVVHIVFGAFAADDQRPAYLLDESGLSARPAFEIVTAEHLGDGVEVRMLTRPEGFPEDVAGLTELWVSGDRFVAVGVDATVPALLTLLLEDLRDLVDSIEVVDDDGIGPWDRAAVADDAIPVEQEDWPYETAASTRA